MVTRGSFTKGDGGRAAPLRRGNIILQHTEEKKNRREGPVAYLLMHPEHLKWSSDIQITTSLETGIIGKKGGL